MKNGFLAFLNCSNFTQLQIQINLFLSFRFFTFSICFLFSILFYSVFKVHLVGSSGLEPPTSRLSGECSSLLSYEPVQCFSQLVFPIHGGDEEIRTLDPLLAGQVLSQLSYTPVASFSFSGFLDPENRTTIDLQLIHSYSYFYSVLIVRWTVYCFSFEFVTRDFSL